MSGTCVVCYGGAVLKNETCTKNARRKHTGLVVW